jgi:hypothetical protein
MPTTAEGLAPEFAGRAGGDCRAVLAAHGKEKVYGSIP